MTETLKVSGSLTEWLKKSEQSLRVSGFENIQNFSLKREIEADYNTFDNIVIKLTPLTDGKLDLLIEASKPELIELYKNGILNEQKITPQPTYQSTPTPQSTPTYQSTPTKIRKDRSGCLKSIIIGVCILAVVFLLFSCIGMGSSNDSSSSDSASPKASTKSAYAIGETATLDNVNVTLMDVTEDYGDGMFAKPDEGSVFVICEFYIDNQSNNDIAVSSISCFDAYCDSFTIQQDIVGSSLSSKPQLDGSVAVGKKMDGVIVYQVPTTWSELEINFKPNFWSGKTGKFIAKNV